MRVGSCPSPRVAHLSKLANTCASIEGESWRDASCIQGQRQTCISAEDQREASPGWDARDRPVLRTKVGQVVRKTQPRRLLHPRMLRGVHLLRRVSTALRTACGLKHRPPKRTGTWETVRRTRNAVNDAQTQAKERYAVWTRPP